MCATGVMIAYWLTSQPTGNTVRLKVALVTKAKLVYIAITPHSKPTQPPARPKTLMLAKGRDVFINDVLKDYKGKRVEPVHMDAEAPLFLMYSSGTTGKPKGCQHRTGGYLAYVTGTSKWIQDIHP